MLRKVYETFQQSKRYITRMITDTITFGGILNTELFLRNESTSLCYI